MNEKVSGIVCCPHCKKNLSINNEKLDCVACGASFSFMQGVPLFIDNYSTTPFFQSMHDKYFNWGLYSKAFNLGARIISSDFVVKNPIKELFQKNPAIAEEKVVINIGSGNRRLAKGIINIDIDAFPNVDIVADGHALPVLDSSADIVIIETVLEHVRYPYKMVAEIKRVLKTEGVIYSVTPFLHPYHGYPSNFLHFSIEGMRDLFDGFKEVEIGINRGPSCALLNIVSEYFTLFSFSNNKYLYTIIKAVVLLLMLPLKYLDLILVKNPEAHKVSACLYFIGEKK